MTNLHGPAITKFQCSICSKLLSRKDNLLRHTITSHDMTETKFKKIATPKTIERLLMGCKSWTPPPECRAKTRIIPKPSFKPSPKFRAITIERAALAVFGNQGRIPPEKMMNTDLIEDLYLSPSTSSSSLDYTICQDEVKNTPAPTGTVYGVFK